MLEATVTLNLKRMLLTDAGLHHLEDHMEKEFSKENLDFWEAAKAYRAMQSGRLAMRDDQEEKALEIENKRRVAKGLGPLVSLSGDEGDPASEEDEEEPKNGKKTMTGKPMSKVETSPKDKIEK